MIINTRHMPVTRHTIQYTGIRNLDGCNLLAGWNWVESPCTAHGHCTYADITSRNSETGATIKIFDGVILADKF